MARKRPQQPTPRRRVFTYDTDDTVTHPQPGDLLYQPPYPREREAWSVWDGCQTWRYLAVSRVVPGTLAIHWGDSSIPDELPEVVRDGDTRRALEELLGLFQGEWSPCVVLADGSAALLIQGPPYSHPQKEIPMPLQKPTSAAVNLLTAEAQSLGEAALLGGKLAAIDQAGETLLDIFKVVTSRAPALAVLLESVEGRELAKLIVASSLHAMAKNTDLIPAAAGVARVTELQVTVSTYKLVAPQLTELRVLVEKLSGLGALVAPGGKP